MGERPGSLPPAAPGAGSRLNAGRLREHALRASPLRFAAYTGIVSVAASLALTLLAMRLLYPRGGASSLYWAGIAISVAIPALVAPPIAWTVATLLQELAQARNRLERLATTDSLTGAYNRRHLYQVGGPAVEHAVRQASALSVLMLDLDDFKEINDRHGHLTGDAVLRAVADACARQAGPHDTVARYGGEEFVVLMPGADTTVARALGERLLAELAALTVPVGGSAPVAARASVGVSGLGDGAIDFDALLARADAAMYRAKRAGKNRVVVQ